MRRILAIAIAFSFSAACNLYFEEGNHTHHSHGPDAGHPTVDGSPDQFPDAWPWYPDAQSPDGGVGIPPDAPPTCSTPDAMPPPPPPPDGGCC